MSIAATKTTGRSRQRTSTRQSLPQRAAAVVRLWINLFSRHQILNSASAISFQILKALVPLALFGIALLKMLGLADVWTNTLADGISRQLTPTAFTAINTAVGKVLRDGGLALPALAGTALLWYGSGLVRACMSGMNLIYEAEEQRPFLRRWGISFALALGVAVAVVLAVLGVTVAPRIADHGVTHTLLLVLRWPFAVIALGVGVGLLVHYGPAERRRARWSSAGSAVVVAAWIVEALIFDWYVSALANFKSASGALTVFLVLAAYLYTASIIFLVGVQIDELLRKDATSSEQGIIGLLLHGARVRG
ncbi:MAG: YihY/virulence factor BrkB family protein [Actinobacteria bacterium]|nr:YihY/virulence factor BrkB family protein [Actinomycetota bacterium]